MTADAIVILGAGIQAKHAVQLIRSSQLCESVITIYDDIYPHKTLGPSSLRIQGTLKQGIETCLKNHYKTFIALGTKYKALSYNIYNYLKKKNTRFINLIHHSCIISDNVTLRENILIMPGSVINYNTTINSLCTIFSNSTVEHDCYLSENVTLGPSAVVSGFARIGKHTFIGSGAVCLPKISVGERTIIGAGSVVTKSTPEGVILKGNPAQLWRKIVDGDDAPTLNSLNTRYHI